MSSKDDYSQSQAIHDEIEELEKKLREAKARLRSIGSHEGVISPPPAKVLRSDGKKGASFRSNHLTLHRTPLHIGPSLPPPPGRFRVAFRFIRIQQRSR